MHNICVTITPQQQRSFVGHFYWILLFELPVAPTAPGPWKQAWSPQRTDHTTRRSQHNPQPCRGKRKGKLMPSILSESYLSLGQQLHSFTGTDEKRPSLSSLFPWVADVDWLWARSSPMRRRRWEEAGGWQRTMWHHCLPPIMIGGLLMIREPLMDD